jgi:two-component system cell cycle sensor histidine kinase/response regulator CckA
MTVKKILVVDNHPVILKFMTQLFSKSGFEIRTARDGLEALNVLDVYTPDVAFIDLVMPNISGDKLCRIIRGIPKLKDVRLIILSAVGGDQMGIPSAFGADACIAKGAFPEMARRVLAAIEESAPEASDASRDQPTALDDSHLREVTKELLSVKRHLEVIMMSISEGMLELNDDFRVVYANPSALSIFGIPEEKLLGAPFPNLFDEHGAERVKEILKKQAASVDHARQKSVFKLDGKEVTVNISPIQDQENKIIVVLNDITEQTRMEAQLQQAQKMEAIGTLAGGIAHDFNNLLMAIQGTVSLLLFSMDPDHPHYEKLASIERQVESGAKLTRQLLGYARKGKYEIRPINLNRLVQETSTTFGRTKKEITIRQELADDLFATDADEGQIQQVLLNLYVNAAGAMPNGGHLVLKTCNATHENMEKKPYDTKPGRYVALTVTDTGIGMDEATMKRIFEPFFTTKEMGRGTGLGLASVYGIVKSHGGYIEVDSKKGAGTTFRIYLPASDQKDERDSTQKPREEITQGNETILLVDDERMILEVGSQLLEAMGYRVVTAKDGKEAIDVYRARKEDIDLLILDMIMPEMNGGDVYDKIKKINPNIKVLLSSGYSVEGQAGKILARGCDGFIQKPFHMGQLSQSIRQVLAQ